jgi:ribonuclease P protein component
VQTEGRRFSRPALALLLAPSAQPAARIGFTVSRKVGGAVIRNRVRRQLRAIVRATAAELPAGFDLVLIAQPKSAHVPFGDLETQWTWLLSQARAFVSPPRAGA